MKTVRAIVIQPNAEPEIVQMGTDLEDLQEKVGGLIEEAVVRPKRRYTIYVNECGRINGMHFNRSIKFDSTNEDFADEAWNTHDLYGPILLFKKKGFTEEEAKALCAEWRQQ